MNNDRIYWLRDIAKKLSEEEIKSEELSKYIGNYSI